MTTTTVHQNTCPRCQYEWTGRLLTPPKACPRCNKRLDTPLRRKPQLKEPQEKPKIKISIK